MTARGKAYISLTGDPDDKNTSYPNVAYTKKIAVNNASRSQHRESTGRNRNTLPHSTVRNEPRSAAMLDLTLMVCIESLSRGCIAEAIPWLADDINYKAQYSWLTTRAKLLGCCISAASARVQVLI